MFRVRALQQLHHGVGISKASSLSWARTHGVGREENLSLQEIRWWRQVWRLGIALGLGISGAILITRSDRTLAQIVGDGTVGTLVNGVRTLSCPGGTCTITGGTQTGSNLFHSFSQFSVPKGGTAFFNNDLKIENIISRVIGPASNIDGILRANGTANLILINPNGITFGPNAQLNLGGSFVASTANSITLPDGTKFSATTSQTPRLFTVSVPFGVQFGGSVALEMGANSGDISVGSDGSQAPTLVVQDGNTLALVSRNVTLNGGTLQDRGGRIQLDAIADVTLKNGAQVDVVANGGGSIAINARSINISGGNTRVRAGIDTGGSVTDQAGDININATEAINIDDGNNNPMVSNQVLQGGTGNSGNINITTGSLFLTDAAALVTSTSGTGNAGNVKITAKDTVSLEASGIASNVESGGVGKGGNIEITTGSLSVTKASQIQTLVRGSSDNRTPGGQGDAGEVKITAKDTVSFDGRIGGFPSVIGSVVLSGAVGNGGRIEILTESLSLTNGAALSTSNEGTGDAGSIVVRATDSIRLEDQAEISANTLGGGGNINLESPLILLRGSGLPEDTVISTNADGSNANAGKIDIKTTFLVGVPKENSDITANSKQARGGQVFIDVSAGGIYGLQFRQELTPRSDITAKGRDPSLTGTVSIYTSGIDPEKGLAELPVTVTDPSNQIVVGCAAARGNSFTITGRGGLPEDPTATIRGQTVWRDLQDYSQGTGVGQASPQNPQALIGKPSPRLVEANSWMYDENGNVVLVAVEGNGAPSTYRSRQPNCQDLSSLAAPQK